jgi:hypothetical protein
MRSHTGSITAEKDIQILNFKRVKRLTWLHRRLRPPNNRPIYPSSIISNRLSQILSELLLL